MIYRGPSFLAVVWLATPPLHPPNLLSERCLSFSVFLCVCRRSSLLTAEEGGERGAKSYDGKKAWSSLNHSILPGCRTLATATKGSYAKDWELSCGRTIRMPNVTQVRPADEDLINVTNVKILEMWGMWRMCGYERNVTNYEECEGGRVGEMWGCESERKATNVRNVKMWEECDKNEECEVVRGMWQIWKEGVRRMRQMWGMWRCERNATNVRNVKVLEKCDKYEECKGMRGMRQLWKNWKW